MINAEFVTRIIKSIFYAIIIIGVLSIILSMTILRDGLPGSMAGFIAAMIVFGIALKSARLFLEQPDKKAATVMLLIISQLLLWALVGVCIIALKLNAVAFLIGFTSLPLGIIWGYIFSTFKKNN